MPTFVVQRGGLCFGLLTFWCLHGSDADVNDLFADFRCPHLRRNNVDCVFSLSFWCLQGGDTDVNDFSAYLTRPPFTPAAFLTKRRFYSDLSHQAKIRSFANFSPKHDSVFRNISPQATIRSSLASLQKVIRFVFHNQAKIRSFANSAPKHDSVFCNISPSHHSLLPHFSPKGDSDCILSPSRDSLFCKSPTNS